MDTFGTTIEQSLRSLTGVIGDVPVRDAAEVIACLPADSVIAVIESTTAAMAVLERLRTVAAGAAARLSTRDAGQGGLAQTRGHRSAVTLIQDLTGISRAQAGKVTRLGQELLETTAPTPADHPGTRPEPVEGQSPTPDAEAEARQPWHACLSEAFTAGRISVDQQAAIRRGLGDPPTAPVGPPEHPGTTAGSPSVDAVLREAWATAAEQLIEEASRRTVEDLAAAARTIRDVLDPDGAARRFTEQHEARSFRSWTDPDGVMCAKIRFEPGGAALITAIRDAAMRPRRGGPRFVDPDEKAAAEQLAADPRTNEQLEYDLLLDLIRAGALADSASVYGARQAGVRVIMTDAARQAARTGRAAVAVIEDTGGTVPAAFAAQHACDTGTLECVVDTDGNPLNLGREARLFTAKQRLALALRDGGCTWPGRDHPPTAKPTTSTNTPKAAEPTSTAASCSAASTMRTCTTTTGGSPETAPDHSASTPPSPRWYPSCCSHAWNAATPSAT